MQSVRVKSGKPAADLASLRFKVFASPGYVVEVAGIVSAVIAYSCDLVVKFGKLDLIVAAARAGGIYVGPVLSR